MDFISPKSLRLILKTLSTIEKVQSKGGNPLEQNKEAVRKPISTFTNFSAKNNVQNQIKAQMLNRAEQSLLMKELLNLPKDLKELLVFLGNKNTSSQTITRLLQSNLIKINPEVIQQLLQANSKEVINKLIRLIQQTPGNTQGYEQLKPLLGLLSQIIPARESGPQEILTQLLLLYLPWLPLMEEQKIQVRFEKKKSGGSDNEKIAMVIYISTINLGRFKVTLIIAGKHKNLNILIEHISEDHQEQAEEKSKETREILKEILKTLDSEMKEEKIKAKTSISEVKQKNFKESVERDVTVSEVNDISPAILLAAQKVTHIILEMDEKICLLEKRKESIDTK